MADMLSLATWKLVLLATWTAPKLSRIELMMSSSAPNMCIEPLEVWPCFVVCIEPIPFKDSQLVEACLLDGNEGLLNCLLHCVWQHGNDSRFLAWPNSIRR